jgi:general secretion pathway protein F
MAVFTYSALKKDGSMATGELQAVDRSDAFRRLDRNGLQPVSLKQKDDASIAADKKAADKKSAADKKAAAATPSEARADKKVQKKEELALAKQEQKEKEALVMAAGKDGKIPAKTKGKSSKDGVPEGPVKLKRNDVIMFTEELSDLLAAGLQLEPALRIMESRDEMSAVKDVTAILRSRIRDGSSFSGALRAASPSFGDLYCNMSAAGEISGALPKILKRQAEYMVSVQNLQSKVVTAMIYPICLIVAGLAVTILFMSFLIPRLAELLKGMGRELPWVARTIMNVGNFALSYWWAIFLLLGLGVWAFQRITSSATYRPKWDEQKVKMKFFGPLQSARFFVQFLETLANLIGNGLPLLRALELTRDATVNLYLKSLLNQVIAIVGEGGSLSRALKKVGYFPSLLTDMITVGEQTGDMEHALERTAHRYEKELQRVIDRGMALITPVIIAVMAVIVGAMAYMMVSIIIQSVTSIRK